MDNPVDVAPIRMRTWIEQVDKARAGTNANRVQFGTIDEAASRLQKYNPQIDAAMIARRAKQLTVARGDGLTWKHDPLHATTSPLPFYGKAYEAFVKLVACPTLYVSGGAKGYHVPEEEQRLGCFQRLTRVTLEGGHALHWTMAEELGGRLAGFWRGGER
jgi:hypothetical protein